VPPAVPTIGSVAQAGPRRATIGPVVIRSPQRVNKSSKRRLTIVSHDKKLLPFDKPNYMGINLTPSPSPTRWNYLQSTTLIFKSFQKFLPKISKIKTSKTIGIQSSKNSNLYLKIWR
jgi:hypothetical protein